MDMMKMLGQLQESQKNIEEAKSKLANEFVTESSNDGLLTVEVSKNGRVKDLDINDELMQDKEQLVDYLILTLNKALEKAQNEYDSELQKVAKKGLPNIPGMPF